MKQFNNTKNEPRSNNHATILLIIFGLLLTLSAYLLSPLNRIETVNVRGNEHLPEQTVLANSGINTGMPFWETWLDKSYYENSLTQNVTEIEDASISIENLQTMNVTVSEYNILAQVETEDDSPMVILENKDIVQNDYSSVSSIPFLINFDIESDEFDTLLDELNDTNESVLSLISEIELLGLDRNPELLKVNMNDGSQVLINILNFANRINYYPLLSDAVDNELGVFDLEAGTFFTPYSSDQETEPVEEADLEGEEESTGEENTTENSENNENDQDEENTQNENNEQ